MSPEHVIPRKNKNPRELASRGFCCGMSSGYFTLPITAFKRCLKLSPIMVMESVFSNSAALFFA